MGWLNIFGGKKNVIADTADSIGDLAKDMRTAITGDMPPEKRADLLGKILDILGSIAQSKSNIIIAEAQSESWLTRTWRPIVMLDFVLLINLVFFGVIGDEIITRLKNIPPQLWTLLSIGLGGYIGGRTVEKVIKKIGGK